MKNIKFKQISIVLSFICLSAGSICCSLAVAVYVGFTSDLAVFDVAEELFNNLLHKMIISALILLPSIILSYIIKNNNRNKIVLMCMAGYLISTMSAFAAYYHVIDFPLKALIAFVSVIPFIASFLLTLGAKYDY